MDTEASEMTADLESRRTALWLLQQTLAGHGLSAETVEAELLLVVAGVNADGFRTVSVRCHQRADDGGNLWFFLAQEEGKETEPLAPVDRIVDAVTAILGERVLRM